MGRFDWQSEAACTGMDPNTFILDRGQSAKEAKRVCAVCSVTKECDDYAESVGAVGVWGGRVHRGDRVARSREVDVVVGIHDIRPRKSDPMP